ncbi:MAG: hypothetical protein ACI4EI_10080 [Muricoprocola sp.]
MSVGEELYNMPRYEEEVGRRHTKIRILGRIVEVNRTEQSVNMFDDRINEKEADTDEHHHNGYDGWNPCEGYGEGR